MGLNDLGEQGKRGICQGCTDPSEATQLKVTKQLHMQLERVCPLSVQIGRAKTHVLVDAASDPLLS